MFPALEFVSLIQSTIGLLIVGWQRIEHGPMVRTLAWAFDFNTLMAKNVHLTVAPTLRKVTRNAMLTEAGTLAGVHCAGNHANALAILV